MTLAPSEPFYHMLCQAVDLCAKAVDFYTQSAHTCTGDPMEAIFDRLKDLKLGRLRKLEAMREASSSQDVAAVCRMDETDMAENKALFTKADAALLPDTCPLSAQAALEAGLALELEIKAFYETKLEAAEFPDETRFLRAMAQEATGHYMLLNDMKYYFEDPAAWTFAG